MIERYVFVKLNDDHCSDVARAEFAAHTRKVLPGIPGVASVSVGIAADDASAASWDISIVVRFATIDAVEPYRVHPEHVAYLDYLGARSVIRKAWNFALRESAEQAQ